MPFALRTPSGSTTLLLLLVIALLASGRPVWGQQQLVPANGLICNVCGSGTPPGVTSINCDSTNDFECTKVIKDDVGNQVQVWCINKSFYALLYTPKNGKSRFVGRCPFGGGRNAASLWVVPDNNHNSKYDHLSGTIWTSHDGPAPWESFGYTDDDSDGKFDRWSYAYSALTNKVKQENLECTAYGGSSCQTAQQQTKTPTEGCFQAYDLKPNPMTGEEHDFISTTMAFPRDVTVRERFVMTVAHAEIAVEPEGEMAVAEFLGALVATVEENCYLSDLVGIRAEYEVDQQGQQNLVGIPCLDPQEIAIREADPALERLAPVQRLEGSYDRRSGNVRLNWALADEYDTIVVWRNGNRITNYYPGDRSDFVDDFESSPLDFLEGGAVEGTYTYTVFGWRDNVHSIARDVTVTITPDEPDDGEPREQGRFSIDVMGGVVGFDRFEETEGALEITPAYTLVDLCARPEPPKWCHVRVALPVIWVFEPYPDPWREFIVVIPGPLPDPQDLEVGPTWMVAANLEVTRGGWADVEHGWRPSVFAGAGFQHDSGQTTEIAGLGSYRTVPVTSPMVTYGAALTYRANPRASLRIEARGVTAFMDTMDVFGPEGSTFTLEGETMTSFALMVGGTFRF